MVCSNCGKTIPDNSTYCLYCHAPTGLDEINVNIDVLEDEELSTMIAAENAPSSKKMNSSREEFEMNVPGTKKKTKVIISLVTMITGIAVAVGIGLTYTNSYGFIMKKADKLYSQGDFATSYKLYEKALEKNTESVEALLGAGSSAKQAGEYEKSEELFIEVLKKDEENEKAFTELVDLYVEQDEQDKIQETAPQYAVTPEQIDKLNEVSVDIPLFIQKGGEYDSVVLLELTSKNKMPIYYTTDGTSPTSGEGQLYEGVIEIGEGTTTVKASCYKNSTFGPVAEETFVISLKAPSLPVASPMSGTFTEETFITITSEVEGAFIYYTWDGTTPTARSAVYKEPIPVIEGNNILSVIVISPNGKTSEVLKCSYTYFPSEEEETTPGEGETEDEALPEETESDGSPLEDTEEIVHETGKDAGEEKQ